MSTRRTRTAPPASWVDGEFRTGRVRDDAPPGVAEMQHVAVAIVATVEQTGSSLSELAERSGVDRSALHDVLAGRTFPGAATIARLEHALNVRLWPTTEPHDR